MTRPLPSPDDAAKLRAVEDRADYDRHDDHADDVRYLLDLVERLREAPESVARPSCPVRWASTQVRCTRHACVLVAGHVGPHHCRCTATVSAPAVAVPDGPLDARPDDARVRAALRELDGTEQTAVARATGMSVERLAELGGFARDGDRIVRRNWIDPGATVTYDPASLWRLTGSFPTVVTATGRLFTSPRSTDRPPRPDRDQRPQETTVRLTEHVLQYLGSCGHYVAKFRDLFPTTEYPDGVDATVDLCVEHAESFDWTWAVEVLLDHDGQTAYYAYVNSASEYQGEYRRRRGEVTAEFDQKLEAWRTKHDEPRRTPRMGSTAEAAEEYHDLMEARDRANEAVESWATRERARAFAERFATNPSDRYLEARRESQIQAERTALRDADRAEAAVAEAERLLAHWTEELPRRRDQLTQVRARTAPALARRAERVLAEARRSVEEAEAELERRRATVDEAAEALERQRAEATDAEAGSAPADVATSAATA